MSGFVDVMIKIDAQPVVLRSDRGYAEIILRSDGFDPGLVKAIKALSEKSSVSFDVGANIGCTAILLSSLSKAVFAFEPAPSTFNLLLHNTHRCDNISPFNIALGSDLSQADIQFSPDNRSGGFISSTKASDGHSIESVLVTTLDTFVAEHNVDKIDLVKIDTEGFEGHVLKGAAGSLQRFKPTVIGELNHWCLNAFQRTSIPDFFDQLRSIFPILLTIDHATGRIADLHNHNHSYAVMHEHIVMGQWSEFIGAFDETRVAALRASYRPI